MVIDWSQAERQFSRAANRFIAATGKSAAQVLHDQARLFVRDCAKMTPPFGGAPISESWNQQRKIGEDATARDINRLFRPVDPERLARRIGGEPARRQQFMARVKSYARRGNMAAIAKIVHDIGYACEGVLLQAEPAVHVRARIVRGRVYSKTRGYLVLRPNSIKQYVRKMVADVGKAKAGWVKAAAALGLNLPHWITRHAATSSGLFVDETANQQRPRVTIGNLVDFAQAFEGRFGIIRAALQNRIRSMRKQTEIALQHAARGI
jgi:hypothetical protein